MIPSDWIIKRIGELTDCVSGGTPSTLVSSYWNGSIRWMNSGELNLKSIYEVEGRITEEGLRNSSTKMIPSGCVLIGLAGQGKTRGTVAMNMVALCTNQSIAAILPAASFSSKYLYYNLDSRYRELRELSAGGGGRGGLNLANIKSLNIPLPPTKAEQEAIAEALSDADALIKSLEKLLVKKRHLKQGTMQELLIGKKRLPGFSASWEMNSIRNYLTYERPDAYIVKGTKYSEWGDTPVLTANKSFILGFKDENFGICRNLPVIVFDDFTTDSKYADFPFKVKSSAIKLLRPKFSEVNLRYMFERMQLIRFQLGNHKRHYISEYQNIELPIPHNDEQEAIVAILLDMDAEITALEAKLTKVNQLKSGMMQELLTGRIRLI